MWPPRSLAITHRARLGANDAADVTALVAFARAVAEAGVDALQIRERDWSDRRVLEATERVLAAVQATRCRVLVNERAHVAWAAAAHGVHLRGSGMAAVRLRAVQPSPLLIGRSVHVGDTADVIDALDYALFGTVFPSPSKAPGAPVAGLQGLAGWVRQASGLPVVAVGGIALAQCREVRDAGAVGVAGIDLFAAAHARGTAALIDVVDGIHAVFRDGERAE